MCDRETQLRWRVEQRAMGGSEDEMIKNLIKRVGMKRKRQANRTLNNV